MLICLYCFLFLFHFADSFPNPLTYVYLKSHLAQLLGVCSVLPMGWACTRLWCALCLPVSDPSSSHELCAGRGSMARDQGRRGSEWEFVSPLERGIVGGAPGLGFAPEEKEGWVPGGWLSCSHSSQPCPSVGPLLSHRAETVPRQPGVVAAEHKRDFFHLFSTSPKSLQAATSSLLRTPAQAALG